MGLKRFLTYEKPKTHVQRADLFLDFLFLQHSIQKTIHHFLLQNWCHWQTICPRFKVVSCFTTVLEIASVHMKRLDLSAQSYKWADWTSYFVVSIKRTVGGEQEKHSTLLDGAGELWPAGRIFTCILPHFSFFKLTQSKLFRSVLLLLLGKTTGCCFQISSHFQNILESLLSGLITTNHIQNKSIFCYDVCLCAVYI